MKPKSRHFGKSQAPSTKSPNKSQIPKGGNHKQGKMRRIARSERSRLEFCLWSLRFIWALELGFGISAPEVLGIVHADLLVNPKSRGKAAEIIATDGAQIHTDQDLWMTTILPSRCINLCPFRSHLWRIVYSLPEQRGNERIVPQRGSRAECKSAADQSRRTGNERGSEEWEILDPRSSAFTRGDSSAAFFA